MKISWKLRKRGNLEISGYNPRIGHERLCPEFSDEIECCKINDE